MQYETHSDRQKFSVREIHILGTQHSVQRSRESIWHDCNNLWLYSLARVWTLDTPLDRMGPTQDWMGTGRAGLIKDID